MIVIDFDTIWDTAQRALEPKIQALKQENARLRATLAAIADQYVHDEEGIKLQGMACDALNKFEESEP